MANTQAICNSFKPELMKGIHALGTTVVRAGTTKDTLKAALFLASATVDSTTATYSTTGEVTGTNYTAGGEIITNANEPNNTTSTAFWTPSASIAWTNVTLSTAFDAVLFYNSTQADKAIAVFTFGSQTVTAGNFSLTMPTNDATTGLIRLT